MQLKITVCFYYGEFNLLIVKERFWELRYRHHASSKTHKAQPNKSHLNNKKSVTSLSSSFLTSHIGVRKSQTHLMAVFGTESAAEFNLAQAICEWACMKDVWMLGMYFLDILVGSGTWSGFETMFVRDEINAHCSHEFNIVWGEIAFIL